MSFIDEIKQRKVFRVAAAYAVVGWVLLQFADIVFENIDAPHWVMQTILAAVVAGFFVVVFFTWLYETTRGNRIGVMSLIVVVAVAAAAIGVAGWHFWPTTRKSPETASTRTTPSKKIDSIAVLPFASFSEDKSNAYFADGLSDTLLDKLARLHTLKVVARNSSFQYRDSNKDVRDIGKELGVSALLEGSVQRQGDRIRVIAQLIDTSDGSHFFSKTFDDRIDNLFDLQDRIAQAVIDRLQVTASELDLQRMLKDGTDNREAYELLLRATNGRVSMEEGDASTKTFDPQTDQRLQLVDNALELDPDYAFAWVVKSDIYNEAAFMGTDAGKFREFAQASLVAARTAVAKDPDLASGYAALGSAYRRQRNLKEAVLWFNKALELDPNNVRALSGLGLALVSSEPQRAYELFERERELDPESTLVYRRLFFALERLGKLDQAVMNLEEGIRRFPGVGLYYVDLARVYVDFYGRADKSARAASALLRMRPTDSLGVASMVYSWLAVDDLDRAGRWQRQLEKSSPRADYTISFKCVFDLLAGDWEQAEKDAAVGSWTDARAYRALIRGVACQSTGDVACVAGQAREIDENLAALRARDVGGRDWSRMVVMSRILGAASKSEAARSALVDSLSAMQSWPVLAAGGGVSHTGYLRAMAHTMLGDTEQASAELLKTLEVPDGGIVAADFIGLPPDRSPFLSSLGETPGYETWLEQFTSKRDSLRENMIAMEKQGEIQAPPVQ